MSLMKRLTICLLAVCTLAACGADQAEPPCESDPLCLRYGIAADIPILDPHLAQSHEAGIILRQIFDTLVIRDPATHEFAPGLASAWHISDDGLQYAFTLRQGIRFHDGAAFDAAAVAANIERVFDPQMPSAQARALLGPLIRYEILDAYAIRLTLAAPFAPFMDGLAQPFLGIASPAALAEYNQLRHQFHLAGTGPFRLDEYLPGERVALSRNAEYSLAPSNEARPDAGEIERIEFILSRTASGYRLPGLDQSLDLVDNLPPVAAQNLAGNSRAQLLPVAIPGSSTFFLFNTRREHVNRRELRLALLLAMDRGAIVDQVYVNFSQPAWAPLSLSGGYAHSGYLNKYDFDLDGARDLLAAAGYSDADGDGILEADGATLSLSVVVPPWSGLPEAASMLQRQWRNVGVDLVIETVPGVARLRGLVESGQFDLLPVERYGIDPHLLGGVFLDDGEYRFSRAPDPHLNEMLLSAMSQMDSALRRKQVYAIQARIMEEALILPIRDTRRLTAARADLLDLRFGAYGFYPLLQSLRLADGALPSQR